MDKFTENRLVLFMVKRGFTKFTTEEAIEYLIDEVERLEATVEEWYSILSERNLL